MSIAFPYQYKETPFGLIPDPWITISIETLEGWKPHEFIVDSGSDVSIVSRSIAETVGLDFKNSPIIISSGIEGNGVRMYKGSLLMRIGSVEAKIPALFSSRDDTPLLLGRAGIFNLFNLTFDNRTQSIIFDPIKN